MRGLTSNVTRALPVGAQLVCDDNSGAKVLHIIGVIRYRASKSTYPAAGVCDVIIASVKKGNPKMRKKVERATIIRQRKEYRRANGIHVAFEDNAAVLIDENGLPKGSEIKGAIAREVAERYPKVAAIAAAVI